MRISVEKGDPAEMGIMEMLDHRVFLNGERLHYILTADDEVGMVHHYPVGKHGDPAGEKKLRFGKVEIKKQELIAPTPTTPKPNRATSNAVSWTTPNTVKC